MTLAERVGVQDAARAEACTALLRRLHDLGVETVRVSWADLHGTYRGKALVCKGSSADGPDSGVAAGCDPPRSTLAAALDDGIGIVSTLLLKDTADRTAFDVFGPGALAALPGLAGANNVLLLPDPASCRLLPWAPGTAWLRADPWLADGNPVEADPRRVLQRALAALAAHGLSLRCGLEIEFHIYRSVPGTVSAFDDAGWPAPLPQLQHTHPGYKLLAEDCADGADEPLAIVRRTALALGLPLASLEIELGPSQVEAVFAPTDALTSADHLLLFRNGVRQALRRAGYHATFVCRPPLPHAVASGWHLHQSLVDAGGSNAMVRCGPPGAAGDARAVLSDTGSHWLAGLLLHAPGLAAISAPTVGGASRFRGSLMAPQCAAWGRDNRGAMLRVIGSPGDPATRIENRLGEPMANPYLTMAAQIHAGLDGLQARRDPGPACADPYAAGAGAPLPADLVAALDALADDSVLMAGLGAPMAAVFMATKRQEAARHAAAEDGADWERREYLARF